MNEIFELINDYDARKEYIRNNPNDLLSLIFYEMDENSYTTSNPLILDSVKRHDYVGWLALGLKLGLYNKSVIMDLLFKSNSLERSGWVRNNLKEKHLESISEHMHHMYLIGMIYLPEKLDDPIYSKQVVLDMCLIHDLGETVTGDIPHPLKKQNDEVVEDDVVKAIILALMYHHTPRAQYLFDIWDEWEKDETINAHIAHDMDVVQLNNQLLEYAITNPDVFPVEHLKLWFRRRPKLELTTNIFLDLIKSKKEKVDLYEKVMN